MLFDTVRAAQGRLSGIGVFHRKSILYGAFVWVRRALNCPKRRFPVRAVHLAHRAAQRARGPRGLHADLRGRRRQTRPAPPLCTVAGHWSLVRILRTNENGVREMTVRPSYL